MRYEIIKKFDNSFYIPKCPIVLAKGAITKDNIENKVLLQLSFTNIGNKNIKAVYLSILCKDITGEFITEYNDFVYLDLNIYLNQTFGDNIPVYLPDANIRQVDIRVAKIIYSDGVQWDNEENINYMPVKKQILIDIPKHLLDEYHAIIRPSNKYVPISDSQYWVCSCGSINGNGGLRCRICDVEKDKIFLVSDRKYLQEKADETVKDKEEFDRINKEKQQERNRKIKKYSLITSIAVFSIVVVILTGSYIINRIDQNKILKDKYSQAMVYIENNEFDQARDVLNELGDYKDSDDKLLEIDTLELEYNANVKYEEALQAYNSGKHYTALKIFEDLGDYADSEEQVQKIIDEKIELAYKKIKSENYTEAKNTIDSIDKYLIDDEIANFNDTLETQKNQSKYDDAIELLDNNQYEEAIEILNVIADFKDAQDLLVKAQDLLLYDEAVKAYKNGNIDKCLEKIEAMSDSTEECINMKNDIEQFKSTYSQWLGDWYTTPSNIKIGSQITFLAYWDDGLKLYIKDFFGDFKELIIQDNIITYVKESVFTDTYTYQLTFDGKIEFSRVKIDKDDSSFVDPTPSNSTYYRESEQSSPSTGSGKFFNGGS